jgi:alpha-ketoglutaric semialdehyde dehydrogenase
MTMQAVLLAGEWKVPELETPTIRAVSPHTKLEGAESYPSSSAEDVDAAVSAAVEAFDQLSRLPAETRAAFLDEYAARIAKHASELVELAHAETALPIDPRLLNVELPRTVNQLRSAATAVRERAWICPTIDTAANIRSMNVPLGPVAIFGPNNFPFAFNAASGGDFAAAIGAGCPVIAKANPGHPQTTKRLAEFAFDAVQSIGLPDATVQLLFHMESDVGARLVSDRRLGAVAFTGSKGAGLALKKAADAAGVPIFLEMGGVNPIVILPGALANKLDAAVKEFVASCLMGAGQFCTNPGLVFLIDDGNGETFIRKASEAFVAAPTGKLLGPRVLERLEHGVRALQASGAEAVVGGMKADGQGCRFQNTLLRVNGDRFLADPLKLQAEAFGNAALVVTADDEPMLAQLLASLEGCLAGCFVTDDAGADDRMYRELEPILRRKVGRLLNDKMPTGVAVSAAMHHGGPYPAAWPPQFTAVGIPASMQRFTARACYDAVRPHRLPAELQDENLATPIWRSIDGVWTKGNVATNA